MSFVFNSAIGILCFGLLSATALILSILGNSRCDLVQLTSITEDSWRSIPYSTASVGLWCFQHDDGSTQNNASNILTDKKFDAARAMSVMAICFGCLMVVLYLMAGCVRFQPTVFRWVSSSFAICAGTLQSLVFVVYRSNVCSGGCRFDTGGKCAVSAVVLWFLIGIMTSCCCSCCGLGAVEEDTRDQKKTTPRKR
jgi:hypothetical protein